MASEAHKRGLYRLSNSQLEKHMKENGGTQDMDYAYLLYAANHIQLKEYDKAIAKLSILKDKYPGSTFLKDAFSYLVLCYLKTENINLAVTSYKRYVQEFGEDRFVGKQVEEVLFQTAVSLFNKNKIHESRELFGLFAENFERSGYFPVVLYYQGIIYYSESNFRKAREFLNKALKGESLIENPEIIADIRLKLADCLFNLRDYIGAADLYNTVIQKFPGTVYKTWASFQMAIIEKRKENFKKAEVLLSGIRGSGDAVLNFRIIQELANIKMLLEDWKSAERLLNEIIVLYPGHENLSEIYMQLGFVNFNMNSFRDAIVFFDKASKNPSSALVKERSYFGLGYAYYSKGDIRQGFETWDKLIAEFPGTAFAGEVLFLKGKKAYENRDYVGAETYLGRFIGNFPKSSMHGNAVAMLAESLAEQKKWEKALKACEDFLSKNKDEYITFLYGKFLYLSRDFEKSRKVLSRIESGNPVLLAESRYYLGRIYEYEGEKEKAQEKYLEIITFHKNLPEWVKIAEEAIKNLQK